VHRFNFALKLLQSLEPAGVGARNLAECLVLQLARLSAGRPETRRAPPSARRWRCWPTPSAGLLARRDVRRLLQASGERERRARRAGLIARLEPKPGRRFADVERNIIVPDVIVRPAAARATAASVQLNPDVHAAPARARHLCPRAARGKAAAATPRCSSACRRRAGSSRTSSSASTPSCACRAPSSSGRRTSSPRRAGHAPAGAARDRRRAGPARIHHQRVTTAKYMATPRGTFELKYFFGSALGTEPAATPPARPCAR
jgi:RNA polymerase sigma-54 factor